VTLGSKFRRTYGHILLSHLRLPQPVGPGPRIYIPQEQGGPVIPPGTGFPFCRLLRFAGLWWRYSNPPPHGFIDLFKVKVTLRPTVHKSYSTVESSTYTDQVTPATVISTQLLRVQSCHRHSGWILPLLLFCCVISMYCLMK
jgi:hypothetical protein